MFLDISFSYIRAMAKKVPDALDRIRKALHAANLTHVSTAVGMSIVQVRKIRDGDTKNPRWDTVKKLAVHLGVDL